MQVDAKKYPFCSLGHNYALEIVSGKIKANKYILGACERYLSDVDNTTGNFWFDIDVAEKYLRLVQKFEHVEGHWPTKNIIYAPWQCWVFMNIMGFYSKSTGFRRFRTAHLEVARGNAKSTMASQMLLYFLALDNPNGNYISTVATKRDQARIVLDSARSMARKNISFLRNTGTKVLAHSIVHESSNSHARALSADYGGMDGLKDVLAVCDELHAMNRPVFEVITSGMSKRKDSLLMCITTAGTDTQSVGYYQTQFAKKVATGEFSDDSFFSAVYTLDEADDWADESVWIKANPGLGISVDLESLRSKVEKALVSPSDVANIKIKHMNLWISEANAFYDLNIWDSCGDPTLKLEDFVGKECRLGLDLASHIDITSIGYIFRVPDKREVGTPETHTYYIFDKSFLPEDTIKEKNNAFYDSCIADGSLIKTKGAAISYAGIQSYIEQASKDFRVQECMYDSWNATETAQKMSKTVEMVKVAMNTANLSEPMKKFDSLLREGKIKHNNSPLLRWCLGNVIGKEDNNGNVFPKKAHEKLKIDPIVALLLALAGWLASPDESSVYEERGILTL